MDGESLLDQPYVKDPSRTVRDLLAEQPFGEKVVIGRFARFALGE